VLALGHGADQAGCSQYFEALVDANKKLRRNDCTLNGTELGTFDLPRDGAELARRINLDLDAAAGVLLDRRLAY
jgi:hypothetical protein